MAGLDATQSHRDVTIDKMDYGYIEKCSNEKDLERILKALRSGREGYYPDLIDFCEKRLQTINPKNRELLPQQKLLRCWDLDKDDLKNLNNDMEKWSEKMTETDQKKSLPDLTTSHVNGLGDHEDLPPIRGSHILKGNKKKKVENEVSSKSNPNRIKSSDYKAWDKFDVEKECEKIDAVNEAPAAPKKTISIPQEIGAAGLTEEEKELKATREKEKGNEAFKSGDFEEALSYYSRSISLHPIAASYNNRALVYVRLEQWKEAIEDCNTVLGFDGEEGNLKAMLRRATARKALESYSDAKKDLLFVLDKEPNNARAKTILAEVEKLESEKKDDDSHKMEGAPPPKQGKKMVIKEVDGDSDEDEMLNAAEDLSKDIPPEAPEMKKKVEKCPESRDSHPVRAEPEKKRNDAVDSAENTKDNTGNMQNSNSTPRSPAKSKSPEMCRNEELKTGEDSKDAPVKEQASSPPAEPKYPPATEKLKMKAGEFFKAGQYGEACEHYTKAINTLSIHLRSDDADPGHEMASALLHNNRAACWLKQGGDRACVDDCTEVLRIKTWDAKAFMRRAMAYEHLEKYALSWADYQSAYSMDWQNALAQNGANRVAKHLREIHGVRWREKVPKIEQYPHHGQRNLKSIHTIAQKPLDNTAQNVSTLTNVEKKTVSSDALKAASLNAGASMPSNVTKQTPRVVPVKKSFSDDKGARPKSKQPTAGGKAKSNKKRTKSKSKPPKKNDEPSEKEKADMRAKITRDLFDKLKAEGNDLVKAGDFEAAVQCYTKCLGLCPDEPASYTNRSLCFLKLRKHVSAINDCTEAIRLDPRNVKAFYRRALARKEEGFLRDAEQDILKVLSMDLANKAARKELESLSALQKSKSHEKPINKEQNIPRNQQSKNDNKPISEGRNFNHNQQGKSENKPISEEQNIRRSQQSQSDRQPISEERNFPRKKQVPIEEVESSSSDEAEFVLPNEDTKGTEIEPEHKAVKQADDHHERGKAEIKSNAKTTSDFKGTQQSPEGPKSNQTLATKSKNDSRDGGQLKTSVSTEIAEPVSKATSENVTSRQSQRDARPLTPYEFGNAWSSIADKASLEEYKSLLDRVAPKHLPALLSNKIDDHVISVVANVSEHAASEGDHQRAYGMLYYLTKADRFAMATMFLSDSDKKPLQDALSQLTPHAGETFTERDLSALRNAYGI